MNVRTIAAATSVFCLISLHQTQVAVLSQSQGPADTVNKSFMEIKKSKTFCNLMLALHFPQTGCQVATQQPDKTDNSREQQSNTDKLSGTSVLLGIIPFLNSSSVLLTNARAALDSISTEITKDTKSRYLIVGHANRT